MTSAIIIKNDWEMKKKFKNILFLHKKDAFSTMEMNNFAR